MRSAALSLTLATVVLLAVSCGGSVPSALTSGGSDAGTPGDTGTGELEDAASQADTGGTGPGNDAGDERPPVADTGVPDVSVPYDAPFEDAQPITYSVPCGAATTCTAPAEFCCVSGNSGAQTHACQTDLTQCGASTQTPVVCTSSTQCSPDEVCCGQINGVTYGEISCQSSDAGAPPCTGPNEYQFCDPSVMPSECPDGMDCTLSTRLDGYYRCL